MDCPNCGSMFRERDRGGIKIDFCPTCKGVWLDRGELDKIIEREASNTGWDDDDDRWERDHRRDPRYARSDDDRYRDEDRYRGAQPYPQYQQKSRKKSFFESLTEMVGGGEAD